MLINRQEPGPEKKLRSELERHPALALIVEVFDSARQWYEVADGLAGLEIAPIEPVRGGPNRCRLKLFQPRASGERLCAFFYKRSNLAWSRDRFSYGGVEFRPDQLTETDVRGWLAWLNSGFHPELRPDRLRRALMYDVPD
jgi:hypothetical protein